MIMKMIRQGLAAVCAALFVGTTIPAILFFNLEAQAFTPELYQRVFAGENFYERLPGIISETLTNQPANGLPIPMPGLDAQGWETFLRAVLPPATLKSMGDQTLVSIFAYLDDQSDSASIPLAPLKASLQGEAGVQAVVRLLQTQPACTLQQIAEITFAIMTGGQFTLCNPPEQMLGALTPAIQAQLQAVSTTLPDQITIASSSNPQDDPRARLKTARLLMRLSPALPLGFLLLMTIFAVRSLRDWLNWWGASFLTSGLIAGSMGLSGAPLVGLVLTSFLEKQIPAYLPPILLDNTNQIISAIVDALLQPVFRQGLALTILGAGMALISFYSAKNQSKTKPAPR